MVLGHCLRTSERNWLPVMPGMRSSDTTTSMSLPARIMRPLLRRVGREDLELRAIETAHQRRSEVRLIVHQQ